MNIRARKAKKLEIGFTPDFFSISDTIFNIKGPGLGPL